ncbi:MAG: hypothetical protein IPL39_17590 [Opitutaceae bacterium]|nr:hypothetical protein [Opitutaceae bacterium]
MIPSVRFFAAVPGLLLLGLLAYGGSAGPPRWLAWALGAACLTVFFFSLRTLWEFRSGAVLGGVRRP